MLRTPRLEGTPITAGAAPLLWELLTDPRVARTLGGAPTRERLEATVARQAAHWTAHGFGYWLWRDRRTGGIVGRGGLAHVVVGGRSEVEVGWAVDAERWGEGLGSELGAASVAHAWDELGLAELVAFTLPGNFPSRRIMEKLGFVLEDRHVLHAGLDHVLYRLRERDAPPAGDLA